MRKKLALATILLGTSFSSFGITFEYPYLYKDPRVLGMGNAYVAVGGTSSAVFYNPAGLARIDKKAGWEVDLLNVSVAYGKNSISFFNDLMDATDAQDGDYIKPPDGDDGDDQAYAVNQVIDKYQGENLHLEINNYSSIAKKGEKIGFTIGFLGSVINNTIPHQGFGIEGVIEEHLKITGGAILGLSYDLFNGNLNVGASIKGMYRKVVDHYYTTREIVEEDDLGDYTLNVLAKDGTAISGDIGIIYNFENFKYLSPIAWLNPSVGVSILNIGDLDFGDAGKIPMTVNTGLALRPNIPWFKWTLAFDFVDITKNFEEDDDLGKRIRAGLEVKFWDNKWTTFALRGGVYQSYPTFGAELRLALLRFNFTTYSEEVGAYAGQKEDRRYLINVALGW